MHFCPHCGWPAARLTVEVPGNVLGVPREGLASVPLLLRNAGAGYVEYSLRIADGQPWAFLMLPQGRHRTHVKERRLSPGGVDNSLRVGADGASLAAQAEDIALEATSSDQGGRHADDMRPWDAAGHRMRTWMVHVPIRRLGESAIYVGHRLVVFTTRQRTARVRIQNLGGSPARVKVEGLPGQVRGAWEQPQTDTPAEDVLDISFEERSPARPENARDPRVIPSDSSVSLCLQADGDFEGVARAAIRAGDIVHEVVLYGEPTEQAASLVKHWTVGIDFGTAKSAVYYTDNWVSVEDRTPQPVLWPAGPASEDRNETTTRSAMLFQQGSDVPSCGHHVSMSAGAEGENQLVVESMKTRLRGEAADRAIALPSGSKMQPVGLVAEFMRYLIEEVRASDPFRGRMDIDARMVLTLPVMEDLEAFRTQRENTLSAAEVAGLPVPDLLTPSEPECAALDLLHSLRRGDYTFNGKEYHLQDNETILVFDCGAGTTDVAALRVLLSKGKFEAEQVCAAGYRFGGDTVDDLLLSWLLAQRADRLSISWSGREPVFEFDDLPQAMPLHAARDECRRLKESLFVKGGPEGPREFHTDLGTFQLRPAHVERLIVPFLESIFTAGIMPDPRLFFRNIEDKLQSMEPRLADRTREALWREMIQTARQRVKTLEETFRDAGLRRGDVTFLFITGGTGQVPTIAARLYDFMGRSSRIVVATPEDCTVNVARGAALYYDYRLSGILRCAIEVVGRDPATGDELFREPVSPKGALPGLELERAVLTGARQSVEIGLVATYPGEGPSGELTACIVTNPAAEPRQLIVTVQYGSDRTLYWKAEFADGQVAVGHEAVLSL